MSDLISRADAIAYIDRIINSGLGRNKSLDYIHKYISLLPSADAVSREDYHNLLMASNDIDRALRQYQAKDENPSAEADRPTGEWKGYNADNPDWLRKDGTPIFLVCDKCHDMVLNNSSTNWNYCPNCGARMKGADDE